jgi:hypothetical protein
VQLIFISTQVSCRELCIYRTFECTALGTMCVHTGIPYFPCVWTLLVNGSIMMLEYKLATTKNVLEYLCILHSTRYSVWRICTERLNFCYYGYYISNLQVLNPLLVQYPTVQTLKTVLTLPLYHCSILGTAYFHFQSLLAIY